jgi:hypothetical protein
MIASFSFLSTIVTVASAITVISTVLLFILLVLDWTKGKQW